MKRQNFMVMNYSEIALDQFGILKENLEQLEQLDSMCSEVIEFQHEIDNSYISVIIFAAMAMEAFLNDYAAEKMGDDFFYDNFENLRPFAKLQLISKVVFGTAISKGGKIYLFMDQLFKERNHLTHCKSRDFSGMSVEEYEEYHHFLDTDETAADWQMLQWERIDIEGSRALMKNAHVALRALKEVAGYVDEHDECAYATAKLLCSGWIIGDCRKNYSRVKSVQEFLGVEPLTCYEGE